MSFGKAGFSRGEARINGLIPFCGTIYLDLDESYHRNISYFHGLFVEAVVGPTM